MFRSTAVAALASVSLFTTAQAADLGGFEPWGEQPPAPTAAAPAAPSPAAPAAPAPGATAPPSAKSSAAPAAALPPNPPIAYAPGLIGTAKAVISEAGEQADLFEFPITMTPKDRTFSWSPRAYSRYAPSIGLASDFPASLSGVLNISGQTGTYGLRLRFASDRETLFASNRSSCAVTLRLENNIVASTKLGARDDAVPEFIARLDLAPGKYDISIDYSCAYSSNTEAMTLSLDLQEPNHQLWIPAPVFREDRPLLTASEPTVTNPEGGSAATTIRRGATQAKPKTVWLESLQIVNQIDIKLENGNINDYGQGDVVSETPHNRADKVEVFAPYRDWYLDWKRTNNSMIGPPSQAAAILLDSVLTITDPGRYVFFVATENATTEQETSISCRIGLFAEGSPIIQNTYAGTAHRTKTGASLAAAGAADLPAGKFKLQAFVGCQFPTQFVRIFYRGPHDQKLLPLPNSMLEVKS